MDLPAKNGSDGANLPVLNTKPDATDRTRSTESAFLIAATKRLIAAAPSDALHPRGAPEVSPRIRHGTTFCAETGDARS